MNAIKLMAVIIGAVGIRQLLDAFLDVANSLEDLVVVLHGGKGVEVGVGEWKRSVGTGAEGARKKEKKTAAGRFLDFFPPFL